MNPVSGNVGDVRLEFRDVTKKFQDRQGSALEPRILIAVLIVFFPVLINVMTAVRNIDPDLINLARFFKASRMQVFWKMQVPASMAPMFERAILGFAQKTFLHTDGTAGDRLDK